MKRKILIILILLFTFIGGYALATSVNTWNGFAMFSLKSNGKALNGFDSEGQPIIIQNHAYVPLYMLRQAGLQVTWDGTTRTVDVSNPVPPTEATLIQWGNAVAVIYAQGADGKWKQGTGFMLSGYLITNYHVAGDATKLRIIFPDKEYDTNGEFDFKNQINDVFGIKLDRPSPFTAGKANVGMYASILGYPAGKYIVTYGWTGGTLANNGEDMYSNTAKIDGGSSGSPVINNNGEIIGIASDSFPSNKYCISIDIKYALQELK